MPTLTHTHTYVKYWPNRWRDKTLWKCDDPHCTHFNERSMILGKASLCTKCHREIILGYDELKRVRPTCVACSDTKKGRELRAVRELITALDVANELAEPGANEFPDPSGGLD